MTKEIIELLVEGGKATANQQMATKLGPMGINIKDVLAKINEKTASFKGMKVPVKIIVETEDKTFDLEIGTPPVSELIKKELSLEKGSAQPEKEKVGNLAIEQIIKVAKMKQDSMLVNNLKGAVKSVIGSCNSIGVLVEGKNAKEINEDVDNGNYDKEINEEKTEISEEKKELLKEQLESVQEELKKEIEAEKALEEEKPKEEVKEEEEEKEEGVEEKEEEGKEEKEEEKKEERKEKK